MTPVIRDLSHPISDGMGVYPGDPAVRVHPALELDRDGVSVTGLSLGSHTGTHIDAPSHTVAGGRTLADVPLDELVADALVIRVPGLRNHEVYGWDALTADAAIPDRLPPIVIVDTGWATWFGTRKALSHPAMDPEAARQLVARGMRVLAVDTLSPDPTTAEDGDFPVHEVVLGGDGLIVENLCNIDGLASTVRVGFFPLSLLDDGAPVRAVAFL